MPERDFIPLELIFNPNWWHQTAGISFDEAFYMDPDQRIKNDLIMRRVLHERFGGIGMGQPDPQPRPIIGSLHVAGGFVIPALLGSEIIFDPAAAPQPKPIQLSVEQIDAFEKPDFRDLWPMKDLITQMDALEVKYGYLVGDLNTDGLLNAAYHLYGQELFVDFYTAPQRVKSFLTMIGDLIVDVAEYIRSRTGSSSISVNRMAARFDRQLFLHANCSIQMISPSSYHQVHLPIEQKMAARLQPFGIHHCGDNLHKVVSSYAELPLDFVDVGWGSDVAQTRQALPNTFLNLRLSPVRMLTCTPTEIIDDTEQLLKAAAPLENVGVCCINMDFGTPDENIFAVAQVVEQYRHFGA
jgi:uroporphyrinogen-III decarboxylase